MKDWCTNWPDSIDGHYYGYCCQAHDRAYMAGGIMRKFSADWDLMRCVWDKGRRVKSTYVKWNAVKMYLGVTFLGWPFWLSARK